MSELMRKKIFYYILFKKKLIFKNNLEYAYLSSIQRNCIF